MCRFYATKHKPAYTRLCYRYRDQRGYHVPGRYRCGEYPRPPRRGAASNPAAPDRARTTRRFCACGAPAVTNDNKCEQCYIYDQIVDLKEPERSYVDPAVLSAARQHVKERAERQARLAKDSFH